MKVVTIDAKHLSGTLRSSKKLNNIKVNLSICDAKHTGCPKARPLNVNIEAVHESIDEGPR